MEDSARCSKHPRDRAGWICGGCGLELCVRCAARRKAGTGYVIVCLQCGAYAQPIMVPRARTSFSDAIAASFVFPFSRNGFLSMAAFGAVLSSLELLGPLGWGIAAALLVAYLFLVIRASSSGHPDLPESEDFSDMNAVAVSLGKALLVFVVGLAPALLYVFYARSGPSSTALQDPVTDLLLALGSLWIPVGLLLAAVNSPLSTVLNPALAFQCVKRLGSAYVAAAAVVWGAIAAWMFLHLTSALFVDALSVVPLLPRVFGAATTMYPAIVGARVLGMLLYVRGADVDYGTSSDHLEPALGGLLPPEEKGGPELPPIAVGAPAPAAPPPPAPPGPLAAILSAPAPPGASKPPPTAAPARPAPGQPAASRPAPPRPASAPPAPAPAPPKTAENPPAQPPASDWGNTKVPAPASDWGTPAAEPPVSSVPPPAPEASPAEDDALLMEAILGPGAGASPAVASQVAPTQILDLPDLPPAPLMAAPVVPPLPKSHSRAAPGQPEQKTVLVSPPSDDDITKLVSAGDYQAVANVYRARKGAVTSLNAEQLVRTAEAAMARADLQTASHAYKRVGFDHPKSESAPKALLAAARILKDLKKESEGTKLLTHLVKSYPATREAEEARSLLGRAA